MVEMPENVISLLPLSSTGRPRVHILFKIICTPRLHDAEDCRHPGLLPLALLQWHRTLFAALAGPQQRLWHPGRCLRQPRCPLRWAAGSRANESGPVSRFAR